MVRTVAVLLVVATLASGREGLPDPASQGAPPLCPAPHRPPVDAPVVDPFRPPPHPYGAGNRGLEYGTEADTVVRASAAGRVVFAGRIGAHRYLTIGHGCGLETTYSYLAVVAVRGGAVVAAGETIGRTGATGFHFGARLHGRYVDPQRLFTHRPVLYTRLVPVP